MSQQLANGKQQFIDGNGNPLAGGSVAFYLPGTLTPTNTWLDPALTTLNANPVVLDANGMASIWGADGTQYRQVVQDALGNTIWDEVVGLATLATASSVTAVQEAVQEASYTNGSDSGAVNAYVIALSPAPAALTPGMMVAIDNIVASNTGASTLNVNGLGALPIEFPGGAALAGGEIVAGYGALLRLNHAGTAWILLDSTGAKVGPTPTAGDNSTKLATTAFVSGTFRSVNVQTFTASGTYTPSANMRYCRIEVIGGGAGGGGATAGSSNASCGGGGGAGGYAVGVYSAAQIGASQAITIGAGGAGGASGGAGGAGGTTSVGTLITAGGGNAGSGGGAGAGSGAANGGSSNVGTGGNTNTRQGAGGLAWWPSAGIGQSGFGGNSVYGQGGAQVTFGANGGGYAGQAGAGYGAGGGGACASNGTASGGAGAGGIVIVTEFIGA